MPRYIYGIHPALEALKASSGGILAAFVLQGPWRGPLAEVVEAARRLGVPTEEVGRERLGRLAGGGVHQGVVLRVAEFAYADIADAVDVVKAAGPQGLAVVLDGVEDPHNFGAIVRSAWALGAQAVVVGKDRAASVTGAVVKASAGAIAHMTIARVTNLSRAVGQLKEAGLWVTGAVMDGDRTPDQVDFRVPTALVVGGESSGIRRIVLEKCDFRARIPMEGRLGSLNASIAAAILLYEVARQRRLPP